MHPQSMMVECSRDLTDKYPLGTVFRLSVKEKSKPQGYRKHLYAHYRSPYEVVRLGKG